MKTITISIIALLLYISIATAYTFTVDKTQIVVSQDVADMIVEETDGKTIEEYAVDKYIAETEQQVREELLVELNNRYMLLTQYATEDQLKTALNSLNQIELNIPQPEQLTTLMVEEPVVEIIE